MLRYGVVGVMGAAAHMCTLFILVEMKLAGPAVATTLGFLCALILSYWVNRLWTFGYQGSYWVSAARYCTVSLVGLGLNILIITLTTDFFRLWYGWGAGIAVVVVAINNFMLNNLWTFTSKATHSSP